MYGISVVYEWYRVRGSLNFSFLFVALLCSLVHAGVRQWVGEQQSALCRRDAAGGRERSREREWRVCVTHVYICSRVWTCRGCVP